MPSTPIHAIDSRVVPADPARVWAVLADIDAYPAWWPPSVAVRVVRGGALVGADLELTPKGGRPFGCTVVSATPFASIELQYHGFVHGTGAFTLTPGGDGTEVTYAMDVHADGWLVWVFDRVMSLSEAHSAPMRDVLAALVKRVG